MSVRPGAAVRGVSASAICIGDGETPPLLDGAVLLDDRGRVAGLGPRVQLAKAHPHLVIEHHQAVLLPGLINAHTHVELSALRGRVSGGRGFAAWLGELFAAQAQSAPELDDEALDAGVSELLRYGTAAVGEVTNSLRSVAHLASAPLLARVFHEVFGVNRERAAAARRAAHDASAALAVLPAHVHRVLSPHTPYSMHPELLQEVMHQARSKGERVSIHLAEHAAERAFMLDGGGPMGALLQRIGIQRDWPPPGLASIPYLDRLGLLDEQVIAVHVTDARPEEIATLAARRVSVVLCPRSNLHIEVRLPPLQNLLAAGIRPGLGTDSLASSPSLDVLAEAQALAQRFPQVPARTLLAMATGFGADVLGLSSQVGRIAVGLSPGLVAFPHGAEAPRDPERYVLQGRFPRARDVLAVPAMPLEC